MCASPQPQPYQHPNNDDNGQPLPEHAGTTRAPFRLVGHEYSGALNDPSQPDWTKIRIEFRRHTYQTRQKTVEESVFTLNDIRAFNVREFHVNGHALWRAPRHSVCV